MFHFLVTKARQNKNKMNLKEQNYTNCHLLSPKLLVQGEVIGSCQGICRTAAQVALVENGEATVLRTQVHDLLGSLALPGFQQISGADFGFLCCGILKHPPIKNGGCVSAAVPQVLSSLQRSSNEERCITRPGDSGIYDVQLGLFKVKTLLDLLGSLLGGGKGHVQVTMIWDIWNPTHLLRARQGHGLHPGIPGRLEA